MLLLLLDLLLLVDLLLLLLYVFDHALLLESLRAMHEKG